MPKKKDEIDPIAALLLLIIVGGALLWNYVIQPATVWFSQNWIYVASGIIIATAGGIAFYLKVWLPSEKEIEERISEEEALKKSIIRKRLLKERGQELEGLDLTDKEKELLLSEWVEEAFSEGEILRSKRKPRIKKVRPLSQRQTALLIDKVGGKCCLPDCDVALTLDVHHIIPGEEEGTNRERNLIVLCPTHHRLADRGAISRARLKLYSVPRMKHSQAL